MLELFSYASWFSSLLPLFFIRNARNLLNNLIAVILTLCLFSFITDTILYFVRTSGENNLAIMNGYALIELLFISAMFMFIWEKRSVRLAVASVTAIIVAYGIYLGVLTGETEGVVWQINMITALPPIVGSLLILIRLIRDPSRAELGQQHRFWIACALLLYYFGNLLIFVFSEYILNADASSSSRNLWITHNCIHIVFNVLLARSVTVWRRNNSSSQLSPASQ